MENNMYNEPNLAGQVPEKLRHSKLGVAGFIMSLVIILMYVILVIGAAVSVVSSANAAVLGLLGLGLLFFMLANIVAIILSIIGVASKNKKKGFSVAGLIISVVDILLIGGLMVAGMLVQ